MSVCVEQRHWLLEVAYNWQTLIAGLLAVGAALYASCHVKKQIAIQEAALNKQKKAIKLQQEEIDAHKAKDLRESDKRRKAAIIGIPEASAEIARYVKKSFKCWVKKDIEQRPDQPKEAIRVLMEAASEVDDENFESFRQLLIQLQIFESRLFTYKSKIIENVLDEMIVDIGKILYIQKGFYDFGRFERNANVMIFREPIREQIEYEIEKLCLAEAELSPTIKRRVKNAIENVFIPATVSLTTETES